MKKILKNRKSVGKILVTGSSGLLGLELLRLLKDKGKDAVGTYNSNSALTDGSLKNIKCNVGDTGSVRLLDRKLKKISFIFHCASMTGIDKCEKNREDCWQANIVGTRNIVELAKKNGAGLIYISTGSVFSGEKGNYKENDTPDPKNFYSWTKLLGEEAVLAYEKGIVVRVTPIGIHGVGRPQANFIEWLMDSVQNNRSFNLFNDVFINAVSAKTLSGILLRIPSVMKKGIVHIGSKDRLSKADIGRMVISKFPDFKGEVKLISVNDMPGNFVSRPKEMWFNVDKANNLGLKMPNLRDELESILDS